MKNSNITITCISPLPVFLLGYLEDTASIDTGPLYEDFCAIIRLPENVSITAVSIIKDPIMATAKYNISTSGWFDEQDLAKYKSISENISNASIKLNIALVSALGKAA